MSALFGNRTLKIADSHQSVGRHDSELVKLNNKVYHMHMYTYCTSVYAHAHSVYPRDGDRIVPSTDPLLCHHRHLPLCAPLPPGRMASRCFNQNGRNLDVLSQVLAMISVKLKLGAVLLP